jgi:hypothetical protein
MNRTQRYPWFGLAVALAFAAFTLGCSGREGDQRAGLLVFRSDRDGPLTSMSSTTDGSDHANVINNPAQDDSPIWSP